MLATVMAAVEDVNARLTHTVTGSGAGNARYTITGQNLGTCHQPRGCDFRGGHLEAMPSLRASTEPEVLTPGSQMVHWFSGRLDLAVWQEAEGHR